MKVATATALVLAALAASACSSFWPRSTGPADARPIVGVEGKARHLSDATLAPVAR